MPTNLRLAISGLGLIGQRHADAIDAVAGAALVAVADPGKEGRREATRRGVPCYNSFEEMLTSAELDGVILATPTLLHIEQAQLCLRHGLPMLIEKPISTKADEAAPLVIAAMQQSVPILIGHHRRHNPLIRTAREAIDNGLIGKVRAVQATCWFYKPDSYFDIAPWRKKLGAGPVSVNLAHDIDLLRYLCGEVTRVYAAKASSARGFENEDLASAVLDFAGGAIGTITVSDSIASPWSWENTSGENPVYAKTEESCYLIGGSAGSLSVPDLTCWSHEGDKAHWWHPFSTERLEWQAADPLVKQMEHFCEVVTGRQQPLVSGVEGLSTLQVIEAIQQSAATGQPIKLMPLTEAGAEADQAVRL